VVVPKVVVTENGEDIGLAFMVLLDNLDVKECHLKMKHVVMVRNAVVLLVRLH